MGLSIGWPAFERILASNFTLDLYKFVLMYQLLFAFDRHIRIKWLTN